MNNRSQYTYLVADDESSIIKIISDILQIHPATSHIYSAHDGQEALSIYEKHHVDIVITDILMPNMGGIDLIKKLKKLDPDIQVIVESAFSDIELIRDAMRNGAYDYVLKPFSLDDMMLAVTRIIERIELIQQKRSYVKMLEQEIKQITEELHVSFVSTLSALITALEARDAYTSKHSKNVSAYARRTARAMGWSDERLKNVVRGGLVHDIGKVGIPDTILLKPSNLTKREFDVIKTHPRIGKSIIEHSLKENVDVMDFVYYHHERFDGKGYPEGLSGVKIPEVARIASLADSYDTMISDRVYKKRKSIDQSIEDIKKNSGTQFDPEIAKLFIEQINQNDTKNIPEIGEI